MQLLSPRHHERTKIIKANCNPVWNQELWFLIQEPETQYLYLECFDHDDINYKVGRGCAHRLS